MYTPAFYSEKRTALVHELILRYNFAALITKSADAPQISHLPFLFDASRGANGTLTAHMARANPQWKNFAHGDEALVIFQGPHAYVSPKWYATAPDNVPTWNYAVVHVHGRPKIVAEADKAYAEMQRLVAAHDDEWRLDLDTKTRAELLRQIVVFEIAVTQIDAKFKLTQNRSEFDRESVTAGLMGSEDQVVRATGELMRKLGSK